MKRETKLKTLEEYDALIAKELAYYASLAADADISLALLRQAGELGVRDGMYRHRASTQCKFREEECVTWAVRHMIDLTLVRACLLASTEEGMEKAEAVLMRLIED